ncbi:3578_t:CDS:2 [Acaulospora colombiana]|uniref:3578_t:CDS:1 n=1 Tax=Acaulospora colombiana TaxID=27376 RepID=A0ACA9LM53_9GLOM|nr:3578_t:CDS:2 [Acaulospora colombiana]
MLNSNVDINNNRIRKSIALQKREGCIYLLSSKLRIKQNVVFERHNTK